MVSIQIDETSEHWATILKQLESGHAVQLMRRRTLIATLWPPRKRKPSRLKKATTKTIQAEQRRVGQAGRKLAARILPVEDFSTWKF
jgi:antitoxin (DNA-binding transcriptional repressor) of toxin-antitoxin stability system